MINEVSRKQEDEYFMRLEVERMRKQQAEMKRQMEAQERQRLKKILREMSIPDGMGVIMRTDGGASAARAVSKSTGVDDLAVTARLYMRAAPSGYTACVPC